MRVLTWSSVLWKTPEQAEAFRPELGYWLDEQRRVLGDANCFLVSGTWSEPSWCPFNIPVLNAEVKETKPFNSGGWDYAKCAGTLGFWHAFFRKDWDILLYTDTTTLINCDLMKHLKDFVASGKQIMCCTGFIGHYLDNGFSAYTRDGVINYLHRRWHPDLSLTGHVLSEAEMTEIFQGQVFNPWPNVKNVRCDHPYHKYMRHQEDAMLEKWPAITKPTPRLVELHRKKHYG